MINIDKLILFILNNKFHFTININNHHVTQLDKINK